MANRLHRAKQRPGAHRRIHGLDQVDKIINIDQSPIGRTPRSNPATYIGLFDHIRELYSRTQEARARGYKPGRFSFNVKGGRCEVCRGDGQIKIEMHFLPDVYVPCEQCHGKRYNRETLEVRFKGKTIADVLDMTVEEALDFFTHIPKIRRRLQALHDVGLDYIRLGQPATTLSGGEAQRVKLASELSKVATGRTLYILDEPTTGLHFADVERLLEMLDRLVEERQHGGGDRAQPRRDQDGRPHHRPRARGRRGGRPDRGAGHAGAGGRERALVHGRFLAEIVEPAKRRSRRAGRGRRRPEKLRAWARHGSGGRSGAGTSATRCRGTALRIHRELMRRGRLRPLAAPRQRAGGVPARAGSRWARGCCSSRTCGSRRRATPASGSAPAASSTSRVMVAAVELVEIGEHCMFANGCFVTDGNHRFDDPDKPVPWQGFTLEGPDARRATTSGAARTWSWPAG